jgi:MIP family channel proteins
MNVRALIAEALGTYVLVAMGTLSVLSATGVTQSSGGILVLLVAPFGFGLGLLAAITLFGHVSGGHFNPAVTLAALFDGRIDVVGAVGYAVAQIVGAVAASFTVLFIINKAAVDATRNVPGVPDIQAFGTEVFATAVFVAVILTVTKRAPAMAPLVIALTLAVVHFATIPISGASVNPARALGPAIVAGNYDKIWIYLSAPFLGGIVGWAIYRFFGAGEDEDADLVEDDDEDEYEAAIDELPAR